MFPKISLLFVGAPSRATIAHQQLLAAESLPLMGHFEATVERAADHLKSSPENDFPDVIVLDENLGKLQLDFFFQVYCQSFHKHQYDTLVFIQSSRNSGKEESEQYPQMAGYLPELITRTIFLKEIYSKIPFALF